MKNSVRWVLTTRWPCNLHLKPLEQRQALWHVHGFREAHYISQSCQKSRGMFIVINEKPDMESTSGKYGGCLWLHPAYISSFIFCTFTYFRHQPILALHCTKTCLDKFKNPRSFSSTTLHILFLLPEMLCPSSLIPHHEGLHPAKKSSWASLSR